MGHKSGKVSWLPPALPQGLTLSPGDHPYHIHGGGIQELLEMGTRQANVATLAEIEAAYPLREATLHPRPQGILGFELRRLLALSCGLERCVVRLGFHRDLARRFGR